MKSTVKIGYVVPIGKGLDSFVYREIEKLYQSGMEVILFATKLKKGDIYSPKTNWKCYSFNILRLFACFPMLLTGAIKQRKLLMHAVDHHSAVDFIFALYYARIMRTEKIAQIHCHFGDRKLFIGYYCKMITGLPLSVTIHSHELHVNPNERMFRSALKACDKIFAISNLGVSLLVEKFGVEKHKVVLNRLFLDMEIWNKTKPVRVISVGRFEPQKGFEYLIEAANILKHENIEFIIVGFGPLDVKSLVKVRGLEDKVIVFDKLNQAQLKLLYQSCDIYCLPSISHPEQGMEGIPVVLMEAMACGLPVVATRSGAVPEIVEDILIDERDPYQIASAIQSLANDPGKRQALAKKGQSRVRNEYSSANIDSLIMNLECLQNSNIALNKIEK